MALFMQNPEFMDPYIMRIKMAQDAIKSRGHEKMTQINKSQNNLIMANVITFLFTSSIMKCQHY